MWVSVHDLLHHALGEQSGQLAPQALPLLAGWTLGPAAQPGIREAPLHPRVPRQAVGVSVGGLSEVMAV